MDFGRGKANNSKLNCQPLYDRHTVGNNFPFYEEIESIFSSSIISLMDKAHESISLVKNFPNFSVPGFDMDIYNNFFKICNSIIHASASDIAYPEHWGCFSIKCAFGGEEYYTTEKRVYAVNGNNFLILNEGTCYSSYIYSEKKVESFTLNFSNDFLQEGIYTSKMSDIKMLDNPFPSRQINIGFMEKLYPHDQVLSPILFRLRRLTNQFKFNLSIIAEQFHLILEELLLLQHTVNKEMNQIPAIKSSTRKEIYKRLHYAKDYIDSCYSSEIDLEDLSRITLMNSTHFLRQFKNYFQVTPHQYLISKRMEVAKELLGNSRLRIFEICNSVGYEDISSFIKLFTKRFGHSPEQYRVLYS